MSYDSLFALVVSHLWHEYQNLQSWNKEKHPKYCKLVLFFESGNHYQGPKGLKMPIAEGIKMFILLLVEENWLSGRNATYSIPIADHRSFSVKNSAHTIKIWCSSFFSEMSRNNEQWLQYFHFSARKSRWAQKSSRMNVVSRIQIEKTAATKFLLSKLNTWRIGLGFAEFFENSYRKNEFHTNLQSRI